MNTGGSRGLSGSRTRQYISFVILAMFLGLFVSAMTAPPPEEHASAHVGHMVLSFPRAIDYSSSVDQKSNTLRLSFPGVSAMQLKQQYLRPYVVGNKGAIRHVRIEEHPQDGAQLLLRLSAKARVRLLTFENPHQLMINVVDAPRTYNYQLVAQHETVYRKS